MNAENDTHTGRLVLVSPTQAFAIQQAARLVSVCNPNTEGDLRDVVAAWNASPKNIAEAIYEALETGDFYNALLRTDGFDKSAAVNAVLAALGVHQSSGGTTCA